MNIYRKTIAKLKKIMKSVQDEYDALLENMKQEEEPLLYMDCASEDELLDAYGGGCITRKQLEEGREFFKEASKSKEIGLRDYEGTLKTLKEAVAELYELEGDDEREAEYKAKENEKKEKETHNKMWGIEE